MLQSELQNWGMVVKGISTKKKKKKSTVLCSLAGAHGTVAVEWISEGCNTPSDRIFSCLTGKQMTFSSITVWKTFYSGNYEPKPTAWTSVFIFH